MGDNSVLIKYMNSAVQLSQSTKAEELKLIHQFASMNTHMDDLEFFSVRPYNSQISHLLKTIEGNFKGKFHFLQLLCLQYVLQNLDERCQFLNFGIGNGKSLICSTLAIIIKSVCDKSVIILNKNEYLTYRDYSKFKDCIEQCDLNCSYNKFSANSIVYLDEKNLKLLKKNPKLKQDPTESIVIIDEYDQFIFDSKTAKGMLSSLKEINPFFRVVGISGTSQSSSELKILQKCFCTRETKFPLMKDPFQIKIS